MSDDLYLVFLPSSPDGENFIEQGAIVQKWIRAHDTIVYDGFCVMPVEVPSIPDLREIYEREGDIDDMRALIRWTVAYYQQYYYPPDKPLKEISSRPSEKVIHRPGPYRVDTIEVVE